MKPNRTAFCVLLAGCFVFGAGGCGTSDLFTVLGAISKVNGGEVGKVSAAEWELLTRTVADLAGTPELALTASEAEALAYFFSANGIDAFGEQPEGGTTQGIDELAAAFSSRAEGQDTDNPEVLMQVLQDYLGELGQAINETLGMLFGQGGDGPDGPEGPDGPYGPDGGGAV